MSEITLESIAASVALVAVMFAFRKRRLGPIRGYLLGYDVWAAPIAIAWGSTRLLGMSEVHFLRMHLDTPSGFGLLFVSMWTFWRRRYWFLKGLALFFGIIGGLIALYDHISSIFERVHITAPVLRSFVLVAVVYTLACAVLMNRRRDEQQPELAREDARPA